MATTIKDIAKYAGVGVGTVSRVINNEKGVGQKTREKVLDAMKTLNYQPNNMAMQLRRNATRIIALLVPIVNHPFFAKLAYYIEDEADKFGYSVILVSSQQRVEREAEIIKKIKHREVDGAVFVTHYMHDEKADPIRIRLSKPHRSEHLRNSRWSPHMQGMLSWSDYRSQTRSDIPNEACPLQAMLLHKKRSSFLRASLLCFREVFL